MTVSVAPLTDRERAYSRSRCEARTRSDPRIAQLPIAEPAWVQDQLAGLFVTDPALTTKAKPNRPAPRAKRAAPPPPVAVSEVVRLAQYETSVRAQLESDSYHRSTAKERQAASLALQRVNRRQTLKASGSPLVSDARLGRFDLCGSMIVVWKHKDRDDYALRGNFCRDRFCPACARQLRARIRGPIKAAIDLQTRRRPDHPARIGLLTLKVRRSPLPAVIARMQACWRALSKDEWFREHCSGGIWAMETKYKGSEDAWYVHMHLILLTPWLTKSTLQDKWLAITGDSYYASCRQITDPHGEGDASRAAGYITKYITKPARLDDLHTEQGADLIEAAHGKRLWTTFGTLKAAKAEIMETWDEDYTPAEFVPLASLGDILLRALSGCPEAAAICGALHLPVPTQRTLQQASPEGLGQCNRGGAPPSPP